MESLLGFKLDFWDYAAFGVLFLLVLASLVSLLWLAGLPGRIAIQGKHTEVSVIKLRNAQLANRINLHLALGGSFNSVPPALTRTGSTDARGSKTLAARVETRSSLNGDQ